MQSTRHPVPPTKPKPASGYRSHSESITVEAVTAGKWVFVQFFPSPNVLAGMPKPACLFDGRNVVELPALRKIGFKALGIGKPA